MANIGVSLIDINYIVFIIYRKWHAIACTNTRIIYMQNVAFTFNQFSSNLKDMIVSS